MKNIKNIIIVILLLVVVGLVSYILINDVQNNDDIQKTENFDGDYKTPDNNYSIEKDENISDCIFTRTFRMISNVDYSLAADGVSFVVVDDYQGYRPFVVAIPSSIEDLEYLKYYEFTYHIKGKGKIDNFFDLNSYLIASLANKYLGHSFSDSINVDLNVEETSKVGFNQTNEMICK